MLRLSLPSSPALGWTLAATALLALAGVARAAGDARFTVSFLLEVAFLISGGVLVVRATLARAPGASALPSIRVCVVVLVLAGLGQLIKKKQSYPFVAFTMYGGRQEGAAIYYEYEARLRSGRTLAFQPSRVVPTLGSARIVRGLSKRLDAVAAGRSSAEGRAAEALVTDAVRALARLHHAEHGDDPVIEIEAYRVTLGSPFLPAQGERELVLRVAVEPAGRAP